MVYTIDKGNITNFQRINAVQTGHVESILVRIRATLMMGIDTAFRTEEMPCCHSVKLIETQNRFAFGDFYAIKRNRGNNSTAPAAHGTVASTWIVEAVGKS